MLVLCVEKSEFKIKVRKDCFFFQISQHYDKKSSDKNDRLCPFSQSTVYILLDRGFIFVPNFPFFNYISSSFIFGKKSRFLAHNVPTVLHSNNSKISFKSFLYLRVMRVLCKHNISGFQITENIQIQRIIILKNINNNNNTGSQKSSLCL